MMAAWTSLTVAQAVVVAVVLAVAAAALLAGAAPVAIEQAARLIEVLFNALLAMLAAIWPAYRSALHDWRGEAGKV